MKKNIPKNSVPPPLPPAMLGGSNNAALAKRKGKAAELLAQDRQKLLSRMPFVGGLLMRLDLVPVSDYRLDTAATDGDRIFVDIDFYAQLNADERLFVLAHEAWHCALIHFARRAGAQVHAERAGNRSTSRARPASTGKRVGSKPRKF